MSSPDPKKALKRRVDFLERSESSLTRKVTALEKRLFLILAEKVFNNLETENGFIKSSKGNLKVSQAIDRIFKQFARQHHSEVVNRFKDDLLSSFDLHDGYFREFGSKTKTDAIQKRSRGVINARLGIDEKKKIVSGGFLDNFLNDSTLKNEIVNATVSATSGKGSFTAFKEQISVLVKGEPDAAGGRLQRQYRQYAYDTYGEADRTYSKLWADELKMTAFLYLGGKIKTTRKFCCQRNGLVFTVEEANKWKDLSWSGKPATGYKPLTQLGGYNCRHSTQWIDNDQVAFFRKDIVFRDGKFRKKGGSTPQKLNKNCKKNK